MTSTSIRFETPPTINRGKRSRQIVSAEVQQFKDNPGQWGILREPDTRSSAYALAHQIRSGALVAFRPAESFEAQGRTIYENGTTVYRVYVRYVGPAGEHA